MLIEETEVETQIAFQDRQRIGIMGGTFSPPHLGHLIVAQQVGEQLGLDKIYFMPDAEPPHIDEKESISAKHRERMVRLSISGSPLLHQILLEGEAVSDSDASAACVQSDRDLRLSA